MAQAPDALGETIVADRTTTRCERVHDGLMTVCLALAISAGGGSGRHGRPAAFLFCDPKLYPRRQCSLPRSSVRPCVHAEASSAASKQDEALISDSFRVATAGYSP
jgi:hypothetical protein